MLALQGARPARLTASVWMEFCKGKPARLDKGFIKSEAVYDIIQVPSSSINFEFGNARSLKKNNILELMPNKY